MKNILLTALGFTCAILTPLTATSQEICATHTVADGDKLRTIAANTYGTERDYRYIYAANRAKLGLSPHSLTVGMALDLPCANMLNAGVDQPTPTPAPAPIVIEPAPVPEKTAALPSVPVFETTTDNSSTPRTTAEERARLSAETKAAADAEAKAAADARNRVAAAAAAAAVAARQTAPDHVILVGFNDNLPYSDENLPSGGLVSKLINTALQTGSVENVDAPVFIDRSNNGLASRALPAEFHLSYPWLLPECSLAEFDRDIADLCDNYNFSAPIFEAQMAMFSLSDGGYKDAKTEIDLVGARLCRPASMHTYDLLEDGMMEPVIKLESATDLANCFDDLQAGIVDIVSVNGLTADVYLNSSGQREDVIELADLATIHTVHAITAKDNAAGNAVLDQLNIGLWEMFSSGEWASIATSYLTDHIQ